MCWNSVIDNQERLAEDLNLAMAAYKIGDYAHGDEIMNDSKELWDEALKGCGDIAKNMSDISKKMEELQ